MVNIFIKTESYGWPEFINAILISRASSLLITRIAGDFAKIKRHANICAWKNKR